MKYTGQADGCDTGIIIEKEGVHLGNCYLDYSDVRSILPLNHRVVIDTFASGKHEVSMLGFSYDGFWNELSENFAYRNKQALFIEEEEVMHCEGEYTLPSEKGRGIIILLSDAVCILPPDSNAVRLPLAFVNNLSLTGYMIDIEMMSGVKYQIGRMGYETKPFADRLGVLKDKVKKIRDKALSEISLISPFTEAGLFRTEKPDEYWQAAFGEGCCAVELSAGEQAATYLYSFSEPKTEFLYNLSVAMEAMGTHREIIYYSDEQLEENLLYKMSVLRSEAVRFLRERSAGRLIHSSSHSEKLCKFLSGKW